MQLNKYIAHAGVCSRRKAVELIRNGYVTVNYTVVTHPAYRVSDNDYITCGNTVVQQEEPVYVLFNKPKGCVTTRSDECGRRTVLDYIHREPPLPRIYPVGRLDYNTTGVLLLTNDGDLAYRLSHPTYAIAKQYQVTLNKPLTYEDEERIRSGVYLDGAYVAIDTLRISPHKRTLVYVTLHSGQNRVIHRIFMKFGYRVKKLDRPWYAGVNKKALPRGAWRFLTRKEIKHVWQLVQPEKRK